MSAERLISIFGIRHHGPGSARSLKQALESLKPDTILIEGPPEAEEMLSLAAHDEMKPPVALLLYKPDEPQCAVYYPFAVFSPEWQAIHYGLRRKIPIRFMDLPQTYQMAVEKPPPAEGAEDDDEDEHEHEGEAEGADEKKVSGDESAVVPPEKLHRDPLAYIAEAAGYPDSERWWEHMVEQRRQSADLFAAILEAMTALRDSALPSSLARSNPLREQQREAHMRHTIRQAERDGFKRVAVVCGAWHAPVLKNMPDAANDAALLKGLPKTKVVATWVPWTYSRLALASGYGAGIESPGWYQHLWRTGQDGLTPTQVAIQWMIRVARLLRGEDLDASSASVIESVRLAEALAAVRSRPLPGLPELNESTQTVLCFGETLPLALIREKLIVGETLGEVPDETPMVPLQQDLQREQKRLRLPPEATQKILELDLRKDNNMDRSRLLHRLNLLNIPWGERGSTGNAKGTFWEIWRMQWQPEFAVGLIEAAVWGNTVPVAASNFARDAANKATELPALTALLDRTLLADLPDAVHHVMARVQNEAAVSSDVAQLMRALPPLAQVQRYGNVRQTDVDLVGGIVEGLVLRICIGLPPACASLNDEAAGQMFDLISQTNGAVSLIQNTDLLASWQTTLRQLADQSGIHGLIAGRCCRLLLDAGKLDSNETATRMGLALSIAVQPEHAAAWVEGFLKESGLLLLHDEVLWQVLDDWVTRLHPDTFTALLPLLRRTFSTFHAPERRQMGERVQRGASVHAAPGKAAANFDVKRAESVLPLMAQLLGLKAP
jgi:hypothetical protein